MRGEVATRVSLRTVAVAIALAALIDPAVTSNRATKPDVVVVPADSIRDAKLADDIASKVGKTYTVARGTLAGASATIVAGDALPAEADVESPSIDAPLFAVTPALDRPSLSILALDAPRTAPALSRIRVNAVVRVTGARAKNVDVSLRDDAVSLDHATRRAVRDDDTLRVTMTFVAPDAAPRPLHLIAHVDDAVDAVADELIDVRDQKWAVLFYDPRPSWMSTFVRRSIERDPRFVTTTRVSTSHDVTTSAGNPPGRLDDLAALSLFDAVVVGAPQALSTNDVAGLEAFLRRRGGSVILLLDEPPGGPVQRLIDAEWQSITGNRIASVATADSLVLQATSLAWPTTLPPGGDVIAGGERPVVWREPVGAGTLVVSGALDAWRFRDPATSSFERFWRTTVGDAANRSPDALSVTASNRVLAPGERFDVSATLRDAAIQGATGPLQLGARLRAGNDSSTATVLHLWPRGVGEFVGTVRAPNAPGSYRIDVSVGGRSAELPFVVAPAPRRVMSGAQAQLIDRVQASNGAVVPASQIDRLATLLRNAIRIEPRSVTWHPMRSEWWIIPFVLALSAEWWLRRRRGLR